MKHWGWAVVLGSGATLAFASCASKKPTAIVLAVSTEGRVPAEVDQLEIHVVRSGSDSFIESYTLPADAPIPGTLTVQSRDASDSSPIEVTVTAKSTKKGTFTILRTARLGFQSEKTKLLRMPLRYSCVDFPCGTGQSCLGGTCVDAAVEVAGLPDFDPALQLSVPKGQGACFDRDACIAGAQTLPVQGTESSCSFAIPKGDYNVFMAWSAAPDNPVVVEQDGKEGYAVQGTTATLAPGLCKALLGAGKRAMGITVATTCKTKGADDPVCTSTSTPPLDAGPDAAKDAAGGSDSGTDGGAIEAGVDAAGDDAGGPLNPTAPDTSGAVIPPGSFPQGTGPFSVTDIAPLGMPLPGNAPPLPAGKQQAGDVYWFKPDNTVFSQPVPVHVHYSLPLASLTLLTAEPGAGAWTTVPATTNGAFLDGTVSHFSYFVVVGLPSPVDAGIDAPPDATDDGSSDSGTGPVCPKETCINGKDPAGAPYVSSCSGTCVGLPQISCQCGSANPISCFCSGTGSSAPLCATGSLVECGYPVTCNATFASDPKNCGYCGHDCGTQSCVSGVCATDAMPLGGSNPMPQAADWATDGTQVFYTSVFGDVAAVPVAGSTTAQVLATGQSSPRGIALDASNVYFRTADGNAWKVSKKGGTVAQIGSGATWFSGPSTAHTLAIDATSIYWAVQPSSGFGIVYSTTFAGGNTITLANDVNVSGSIAVDASNLYFTGRNPKNDGAVYMLPKSGGTSNEIATFTGDQLRDLVIGPDGIYTVGFASIYKIALGGPSTPVVVWDPTAVGGLAGANNLAFDSTYLWWTDFVGGRVWAKPLIGGPARVFSSGWFEPGLILSEPDHLAWIPAGQAPRRMPKNVFP